jgi:hypothetical protein
MKGLHFVSIGSFVEAEYTAKSDVIGGEDFGFLWYFTISIPIISGTNQDKNYDFIPLESPCDSEQNWSNPDF